MGRPLELGATWVHWYQAHTWTDIMRYNQPIVASPETEKVYWNSSTGETTEGTLDQVDELIRPAMDEVFVRANENFPNPVNPQWLPSEQYNGSKKLREQSIVE